MKSKFVFGLVAAMLVLALAPSSFAPVNIQIFPNASAQEITTGRTVQTADPTSLGAGVLVSGALVANSPLTTTNLLLDFPANITSSWTPFVGAIPASDPIAIQGATGVFATAVISTINYITGVVTIQLPGYDDPATPAIETNTQSGSFRLVGVRIDANGLTAPVNASYSMSNTANNYILSTTTGTHINALGAGIASVAVGGRTSTSVNSGTATIFTNRLVVDTTASFVVTEGFASSWRSAAQNTTNGTATPNPTQIQLTFTGLVTGVTLPITVNDKTGSLALTLSAATVTAAANVITVSITASSLTASEAFQVDLGPIAAPGPTVTLTPSVITVTTTLAPIGVGLAANQAPTLVGGYPRFAQADIGPVTVVNIIAANTTLLIPFAVKGAPYDTGISLANTTLDPFGPTGGGATASAGSVRMDFYPRLPTGGAGTAFSLQTDATHRPGIGLSADGTLAAGATWTALLSELMASAGVTGDFTGYIFIQANFIDAHGAPFVSDFRNFTSFSPMLVLPPPATTSRSTPAGGVEVLAF